MTRSNTKRDDEVLSKERLGHELPAGEGNGGAAADPGPTAAGGAPAAASDLEKLKAEREALLDRLARLQAEFDNYRKRAAREQQEFREYALADALKSLLPILDSFDRAVKNAHHDPRHLAKGVELIQKQLHDTLAKLGVRQIPAQGEPFDPHLHEAIEMVDTDKAKDNHVLEELQHGYKLKDRLLRPAMVRVARHPHK
jgi:molecular chaperone GrpE